MDWGIYADAVCICAGNERLQGHCPSRQGWWESNPTINVDSLSIWVIPFTVCSSHCWTWHLSCVFHLLGATDWILCALFRILQRGGGETLIKIWRSSALSVQRTYIHGRRRGNPYREYRNSWTKPEETVRMQSPASALSYTIKNAAAGNDRTGRKWKPVSQETEWGSQVRSYVFDDRLRLKSTIVQLSDFWM